MRTRKVFDPYVLEARAAELVLQASMVGHRRDLIGFSRLQEDGNPPIRLVQQIELARGIENRILGDPRKVHADDVAAFLCERRRQPA